MAQVFVLEFDQSLNIFVRELDAFVTAFNLDSVEAVLDDPSPLLRKEVVEEADKCALAGAVLADQYEAVVDNWHIDRPIAPVQALYSKS